MIVSMLGYGKCCHGTYSRVALGRGTAAYGRARADGGAYEEQGACDHLSVLIQDAIRVLPVCRVIYIR